MSDLTSRAPSHARAFATALQLSTATAALVTQLTAMQMAQTTCRELRRAQRIIATEGLSLELMAYIGTGNFRKLITGMPALESFDRVPMRPTDSRLEAGLHQLGLRLEQESTILSTQVLETSLAIGRTLDATAAQAATLTALCADLRARVADAHLPESKLEAVALEALSAESQDVRLQRVTALVAELDCPLYDARVPELALKIKGALDALLSGVAPLSGARTDGFAVSRDASRIDEGFRASAGSALDKGYDVPTLLTQLQQAEDLAAALTALSAKKTMITDLLDDKAAEIAGIGLDATEPEDIPGEGSDPQIDDEAQAAADAAAATPGDKVEAPPAATEVATEALDAHPLLDAHRAAVAGFTATLVTALQLATETIAHTVTIADRLLDAGDDVAAAEPEAPETEQTAEAGEPEGEPDVSEDDEDGFPL